MRKIYFLFSSKSSQCRIYMMEIETITNLIKSFNTSPHFNSNGPNRMMLFCHSSIPKVRDTIGIKKFETTLDISSLAVCPNAKPKAAATSPSARKASLRHRPKGLHDVRRRCVYDRCKGSTRRVTTMLGFVKTMPRVARSSP